MFGWIRCLVKWPKTRLWWIVRWTIRVKWGFYHAVLKAERNRPTLWFSYLVHTSSREILEIFPFWCIKFKSRVNRRSASEPTHGKARQLFKTRKLLRKGKYTPFRKGLSGKDISPSSGLKLAVECNLKGLNNYYHYYHIYTRNSYVVLVNFDFSIVLTVFLTVWSS